MKIEIAYANVDDMTYLQRNDVHVSAEMLATKIENNEILVAFANEQPIGWLRWGYFWDEIPFMNMLAIESAKRTQGIGTKIVHFWEKLMINGGHTSVMTSTQSDETAQFFYRKLGYRDAGSLLLPREPLEIILLKQL